jgi:hypothetical protein
MTINYTAENSGYYVVVVDAVDVSNHTTEREALERATNIEQADPSKNVRIEHRYSVRVEESTVEPPPPPPPPPVEPPPVTTGQNGLINFGYDYGTTEVLPLIGKHQVIIGPIPHGISQVEQVQPDIFNAIRAGGGKVIQYLAYQTIMPMYIPWMEQWCRDHGHNPEDLYYHYSIDTTLYVGSGYVTIAGRPDRVPENRAPSRFWNGAYPLVCPSSAVFRAAFNAMCEYACRSDSNYCDGVFLDSWTGVIETAWPDSAHPMGYLYPYPDHTHECSTVEQAQADIVLAFNELRNHMRTVTGNPAFEVHVNYSDPQELFRFIPMSVANGVDDIHLELWIESISNNGPSISIIEHHTNAWNLMESGKKVWFHSQTNVPNPPIGFIRCILASHYCLSHQNARFGVHIGGAGNYLPSLATHWHPNLEVQLGAPLGKFTTGTNGTLGFVQRDFANARVIAAFGQGGGINNVGTNQQQFDLGGNYRLLNADNSLGPVITSITLGQSEGAILMRA